MTHKIIILQLFTLLPAMHAEAQLYISPGAVNYMQGNLQVTLKDMNLVNNGTFSQTGGIFRFSGSANSDITGTGSVSFHELEIAKNSSNLLLQKNIGVNRQINFLSGLIDLNGFNIDLATTAILNNENENSRIIGANGGQVSITTNLNAPSSANPGKLGAIISSGNNMGSVTIMRGHQIQTVTGGNTSIYRHFNIVPGNNKSLKATLRFTYFDAELNGLDENSLTLYEKKTDVWVNQNYSALNSLENYVEKKNIPDFSKWTLATPGNGQNNLIVSGNLAQQEQAVFQRQVFKLYPNPATHFVDVQWTTTNTSQTSIRIFNIEGRVVKTIATQGAVNQKRISLNGLAKGVYVLVLKTGADQQVSKFVIR